MSDYVLRCFFFFNDTATTEIYTLSLHDALPICEVTVEVSAAQYLEAMQVLHTAPDCRFEVLVDLCGVDYSTYAEVGREGPRFAVVSHLLSISLNQRLRVRVFCTDDDFPVVASVTSV